MKPNVAQMTYPFSTMGRRVTRFVGMHLVIKTILWLSLVGNSCNLSVAQPTVRVDAIGITVSDMEEALAFYTKILPFEKIDEIEVYGREYEALKGIFGIHYKKVRLKLGEEQIELTDYLTAGGRPIPEDSRSNDLWFQHIAIVVSNMDAAYASLKRSNVTHVSTVPQTLPATIAPAAGVRAFYFRDPDGHNLELIYFPEGKGDPKWQNKDKLFLGIDHTAIGISQTARSKTFYNELLGISYKGESFNYGNEQEHLNNVRGARLHISGNRAAYGPGVEFLEYLSPVTGRPYPVDAKADDLIHWETIMVTNDVSALYEKLKAVNTPFVSSGIVSIPEAGYGYKEGFYFRDPDGHVIGIFEK
jgi:catechol 2,3-dioxygenase-like lactoylglutathione lyase family enzyme